MALSYVRIDPDAVVIRRWPRRERRVLRGDTDRFDVLRTKGEEDMVGYFRGGFLAPHNYLALLLKDGTSIRVPCGAALDRASLRLNNELRGV
jgi:hypothetical protein